MGQGQMELVPRWSGIFHRWLVPLGLTSLAGYLCVAGTLLVYDARGGMGPLAPIGGSPLLPLVSTFTAFCLAPLTYVLATWLLGVRGAAIAVLGVWIVAPLLWRISPWSSVDAEARLGYYDEGRGWVALGMVFVVVGSFFIAAPITFVLHWGWRRLQRGTEIEPPVA